MFSSNSRPQQLGVITHGSLQRGIEMKLDAGESVESIEAGTFVVIQGEQHDFFSMITDVEIEAANEAILLNPPGPDETLLRRVMQGMGTYATVQLKPMLMMPNAEHPELSDEEPRSVKTIPAHFQPVAEATEDDVARVFGHETHLDDDGNQQYFSLGTPLGMDDIPVCVDLKRFVERSNAVFGKTGTGKTFLTRLLLCGLLKTNHAVSLIFDMHSEYGLGSHSEGDAPVKGLRDLFPSRVSIFSLDPAATRADGGLSADQAVYLYADQIEPADILLLQDTLNLTPTAAESSHLLKNSFGRGWLRRLLRTGETELDELAEEVGAHAGSIKALWRKLKRLDAYDFFHTEPSDGRQDVVSALLERIEAGKSIVLEFGRYGDDLKVYLLVANVLTRRLRARYEEKTNRYRRGEADKPKQLLIAIEEAHKFLTPEIARETPFGKIAREMRKYFVSLLVVDQRPSAIDDEVLSQIGTKMIAKLNDDKDLAAALVGTSDVSSLRQVLASLDQKQQALLLGHAVPMPIVVKTRTYGPDFYEALRDGAGDGLPASLKDADEEMNELFY